MKKETFKKLFELRDKLIERKQLHQELMGERKRQCLKDSKDIIDFRSSNLKEEVSRLNDTHREDGDFNKFEDNVADQICKAVRDVDNNIKLYHGRDASVYDEVISDILDIIAGEAEWASLEDKS